MNVTAVEERAFPERFVHDCGFIVLKWPCKCFHSRFIHMPHVSGLHMRYVHTARAGWEGARGTTKQQQQQTKPSTHVAEAS